MGSRLPTFGAGPPSQPTSSSSGSQGQTRVPPSPPTPGHCSEDDLMGWFPGRSMLPAPPLKPASGCPLHDAPWTKPLRAGRVDLGRGSWHLMANRAPHKEMYNQGLHCLCGAFRKPFLACLRKRNFCGKCLSFMLWQICKRFYATGVGLMIAHPTNAGRLFARTLSTVCANWQTHLTGLRLRAKGRMCALSNTP